MPAAPDHVETQVVDLMAVDVTNLPESQEPSTSPKVPSDELRSRYQSKGEKPNQDEPLPPATALPFEPPATDAEAMYGAMKDWLIVSWVCRVWRAYIECTF